MSDALKHNWPRLLGTLVVCFCAAYTAWWKTHPAQPVKVKTVIEKVKEGDGRMSEAQCRTVELKTKQQDIRAKFGYPSSGGNTDTLWFYPLRSNERLFCTVSFSNWVDEDHRVGNVTLDLVRE